MVRLIRHFDSPCLGYGKVEGPFDAQEGDLFFALFQRVGILALRPGGAKELTLKPIFKFGTG